MDNRSVKYELIEGTYPLESTLHKGYGISAVAADSSTICSYHDISINKDSIVKLVSLCNELQLDPIHIRDVIDDFLVSH